MNKGIISRVINNKIEYISINIIDRISFIIELLFNSNRKNIMNM